MPHVVVKMKAGRTDDQKQALADALTEQVVEIAGCPASSVSIAIEEFDPDDWAESVYRPDILGHRGELIRAPGYNPFE